jgi:hypothetical protein
MNIGYVLGLDEVNYTGKLLIEECPESNSWMVISFHRAWILYYPLDISSSKLSQTIQP